MNPSLNILVLAAEPAEIITAIRLVIPLQGLCERRGWSLQRRPFHSVNRRDLRWADVVVVQRATREREAKRMAWLREQGIAVVYEIDDLLTEPAEHVLGADHLRTHASVVRQMLGMADAVSASTPRLVECLRPLARSIHLVPNYGPGESGPRARHDGQGPVTLLIAATDRQAVGPMAAGIRLIQSDSSLRVETLAIAAIADSLEAEGVPCRRLPKLPRDTFFSTLASLDNPIGLIPLDDSRFSACKSAVKHFDYACLGIPSICSNHPPYADVIESGHDGLLCADSGQAWADAIRLLVLDAAARRRLADAACRKVVAQHALDQTIAAWETLLTRLVAESRPNRRPVSALQRLSDALVTRWQDARSALVDWNRRRLKNRHVRPMELPRP